MRMGEWRVAPHPRCIGYIMMPTANTTPVIFLHLICPNVADTERKDERVRAPTRERARERERERAREL